MIKTTFSFSYAFQSFRFRSCYLLKKTLYGQLTKMSETILEIDGSTMEGGGQVLRMSLAFSALLKKPIKIFNIRAGRSNPGLRPQHLAGVNLIRDITNGKLKGAVAGSSVITFHPGKINGGRYSADPGTAGSIMLLFQVSFPCLLFAENPSELHLRGGTNAEWAPQIDHTLMVFKPIAERLGAKFSCVIKKRGYYPKGGGDVIIEVPPCKKPLAALELLQPGNMTEITGRSFVAGVLPLKFAHSMADAAQRSLRQSLKNVPIKIESLKEPINLAVGNGTGIVLVGKTTTNCLIGGSALGKRGVAAEEVGEKAGKEILKVIESQACVDTYVQDQLVIFLALAKGKSRVRIGTPTLHTKTAIFIAELMTEAKFSITKDETQDCCIMECEGIGMQR